MTEVQIYFRNNTVFCSFSMALEEIALYIFRISRLRSHLIRAQAAAFCVNLRSDFTFEKLRQFGILFWG